MLHIYDESGLRRELYGFISRSVQYFLFIKKKKHMTFAILGAMSKLCQLYLCLSTITWVTLVDVYYISTRGDEVVQSGTNQMRTSLNYGPGTPGKRNTCKEHANWTPWQFQVTFSLNAVFHRRGRKAILANECVSSDLLWRLTLSGHDSCKCLKTTCDRPSPRPANTEADETLMFIRHKQG